MGVIRIHVLAPPLWQDLLTMFVTQRPRLQLTDSDPQVLLLAGEDWRERLQRFPDPPRRQSSAVLVTDGNPIHLHDACTMGIQAYVSLVDTATDLEAAIRAATRGRPYCAPHLIVHWMQHSAHNLAHSPPPADTWTLSHQQHQVIHLAAQGLSNAEIAECVHLSLNTVKYHLKHAFRSLGTTRRRQLRQLVYRDAETCKTGFG